MAINSDFSKTVSNTKSIREHKTLSLKGPIVCYVPRRTGAFGRGGGGGDTILKEAPLWGVIFSLERNVRGSNFIRQQQKSKWFYNWVQ